MKTKPDITVIVPSFNSHMHIEKNLRALTEQKTDYPFEVIVTDCSEHDQVETICKKYANVNYLHKKKRFYPSEGRNIGAKIAKGNLLVFVDADVILDQFALEHVYKTYSSGIKIFGGALERFRSGSFSLASVFEHQFFNHETQKARKRKTRKNLSSAFLVIDKSIFLKSGGFNNIPRMQDTEFTERLRKAGYALHFVPEAIGYQIYHSTLKRVLKKCCIVGRNLYVIRYRDEHPAISFFLLILLPIISMAKATRICLRNIRFLEWREKLQVLLVAPLIYIGCLVWMSGFYQSMIFRQDISSTR